MHDSTFFEGTERFEVLRRLGAGGMGTVYVARDRERNQLVALKTLRRVDAHNVLRFKHEFRDFQDLTHPHLVSVGELYSEKGVWFFTMELVEGVDFLEYVRPGSTRPPWTSSTGASADANTAPIADSLRKNESIEAATRRGELDEARLRTALAQLADGLRVLHETRKVHRDIKPSNVLVSHGGRVVVLDFGLATSTERDKRAEGEIVGTVEYMAPEQASEGDVGPAADLYAVGVMLHEALTGTLPFSGTAFQVLMKKQQQDGPAPRLKNPRVPSDLDALCVELLRVDPNQRPSAADVIARLGARPVNLGPTSLGGQSIQGSSFVGRPDELALLDERLEASRTQARTVCVHGESGVGKSALVRHFTTRARERQADLVVLAGNCYERESIPFKAIDGVVDSLSQFLRTLSKTAAAALLPRHAALLAQVFPVLARVEAVAEAPRAHEEVRDPQKQRARLFAGLRELLARVAERYRTVLVIDDLQWADADSLALLAEVLCPPDAPALLFVATVRTEAGGDTNLRASAALAGDVTHLRLGRLSPDEAQALAEALVRRAAPGTSPLAAAEVVREAQGHPLFIDALIRYAQSVGSGPQGGLSLDDALWARIDQLEPGARRVLELVSLAVPRLAQETAAQAAEVTLAELGQIAVLLRAAHLVRTSGKRKADIIEPYHDRVRRSVLTHLEAETLRRHHLRLAVALEATGKADPEALAIHWREAGDAGKTAHFALLAAEKAEKALAFDRAAQFYQLALEKEPESPAVADERRVKLADALANAGRGGEAGLAYQAAARKRGGAEALELGRRAAEQLLISGHMAPGLEALRSTLALSHMDAAATPARAIARLLMTRARVRLRGLNFKERTVSEVTAAELGRVDLCWSAGVSLALVDSLGGATFQAKQLLLALDAGEPYRVARALAMESAYMGLSGGKDMARADFLADKAAALAERVGHPHAIGLCKLMRAIAAFLQGRFALARQSSEEAQPILRERCTGVTWELDNAQLYPLWARIFEGDLAPLDGLCAPLLADARGRGDLYLETNLRTRVLNMVHMAADDPEAGRADVERGIASWSPGAFLLQNYFAVHSHVEIDLYAGEHARALERMERDFARIRGSGFWHLQMMRIETLYLRARCALAAAAARPAEAPAHQKRAAECARLIDKEKMPWSAPMVLLVHGVLAGQRGRTEEATALHRQAQAGFTAAGMHLHAAVARRLTGEVDGADAWMRQQNIRNPERMQALFASGSRPA